MNRSRTNASERSTYYLQHSKSSGNVHRYLYAQQQLQHPLQQQHQLSPRHSQSSHHSTTNSTLRQSHSLDTSASSGNILHVSKMQRNSKIQTVYIRKTGNILENFNVKSSGLISLLSMVLKYLRI